MLVGVCVDSSAPTVSVGGCGRVSVEPGNEDRGEHEVSDTDRHVDAEDRAPAAGLGESAADDRADAEAGADHATPHTDRSGRLMRLGEDVGDHRHRDRVQHRGADGLHHTEHDQPAKAGRDTAQQQPQREQHRSALKGAEPAGPVSRRSGHDQQVRQHKGVTVDDPLQAFDRGIQAAADGRQRHVDDGVVHPDDQQARAADGEHQHLAPRARLGHAPLHPLGRYHDFRSIAMWCRAFTVRYGEPGLSIYRDLWTTLGGGGCG